MVVISVISTSCKISTEMFFLPEDDTDLCMAKIRLSLKLFQLFGVPATNEY